MPVAPAVGCSGGLLKVLGWSPKCEEVSHKKMAGENIPRRRRSTCKAVREQRTSVCPRRKVWLRWAAEMLAGEDRGESSRPCPINAD